MSRTALTLSKDAGLTLNLPKCFFLQDQVQYLGHIVSPSCLQVYSKTCNAGQKMQPLTNITQLRPFLGLCSVYRRFVSNLALITSLLTNKLPNDNRHTLPNMNDAEMNLFRTLKAAFVKPPLLALSRLDLK